MLPIFAKLCVLTSLIASLHSSNLDFSGFPPLEDFFGVRSYKIYLNGYTSAFLPYSSLA